MKLRLIALSGAALMLASLARAAFAPIPLDPTSFNQDPVLEKTAPPSINDYVTVSTDQGTNKNGNVWYEVGYSTNTTGLPAHNSIVVASSSSAHTYQMAPDYHTNCVLFVGHNNGAWTPILGPATFTLTTPAPFTALSVLSGSANGPCLIKYVVHYAGGAADEEGTFSSIDWFNSTASTPGKVFDANGLIGMNGGINNQSTNHGSGYYADFSLGNTTANVTSIDFYWYGNAAAKNPWQNGRTFIFAVSGSTDFGTTFSPIAVTGYNQDGVVEADAPHTDGSGPVAVTGTLTNDNTYCSFTMDAGLSKVNYTWYEQGYYAAYPNSGIPAPGSTITSATRPYIPYTMPSTYVGNCGVCLASTVPTATIKLATPAAYGSLAFLASGGNNGTRLNIRVEIQFDGGQTETNWITMYDWFDRASPWAYVTFGQVTPGRRAVRNTPDQFADAFVLPNAIGGFGPQPYSRDPRNSGGSLNPNLPVVRLYDLIIPVANSSGLISSISLVTTNTGTWSQTVSIFAVSGGPGAPPVITQPAGLVTDSATGVTNATTAVAVANDIRISKGYQGTNHISLWVSNQLGNAVSYQWMKAPRGGGFREKFDKFDMSTFANVSGPNLSGVTSNFLTISNATLADSADYVVVASNPYGSFTSFVATVMVLTTNANLLVGAGFGDTISKWSSDGTSANGQETFLSAIDQVQQKWLSTSLGGSGFDATAIPQGTVPFVGPVGYTVTPVNGASIVNSIRFFCANDSSGRDPRDYLLEGSNDGSSWTKIAGGELLGTLMLPGARGGTGSTPLNPMTQPLLEVDFANTTAYKSYRLTITNNMEPVNTPLMQVAEIQLLGSLVPNPPVWVRQPVPNVMVYAGSSPSWGVLAGGYPAPKFQWSTNGVDVPGATNSTFTLANVQLGDSGKTIACRAINIGGTLPGTPSTLTVLSAPTQSYPSAVLAGAPLGYWRLNENPDNGLGNNGVVARDYAGGHNGSYSNAAISLPGYNPVSDPDTAARFGDITADSFVDNINEVDFARGTNAAGATFSVEAWVNGANQSVAAGIVTKGYNGGLAAGTGTGTEQFVLDVTGTPSRFRFMVRDFYGNGYPAQSAITPADPLTAQAVWHHLVGVCDQPNGKLSLYVDGVLAATGTIPPASGILSQTLPMTIGSRKSTAASGYDNQWLGRIDDVALYGSALSASQVLNNFFAAQLPPIITLQPTNMTTAENVPVTFYSGAYGVGTLGYQWYLSDAISPTTPLAGQTSSNLTFISNINQSGNYYQLVVTNAYGAVTGAVAQLVVVSGPPSYFVDLAASSTFLLGHVIQLRVDPAGTAPFTYQWQKNGVNISDDYRTSGTQTNLLTIGYATNADSGNYQVIVSNGQGTTPSTVNAVLVTSVPATVAVPFNATTNGWSFNSTGTGAGATGMGASRVTLTSNAGGTQSSAFMSNKVSIVSFNASFVYQLVTGAGGADGATFCIQNDARGSTVLGGGGGGLGYAGITNSYTLAMNIYDPNTRGINNWQGGTVPANAAGNYAAIAPVLVGGNANPIQVDLSYLGGVLTESFKDLTTAATFTTNRTVDIPTIIGSSTAYVGFTGADGGVTSTQVISNFTMSPPPVTIKSQAVGNSLVLTWPSSAGAFLKSTPSLTSPVWTYNTSIFRVIGNQSTVTVSPITGDQQYFRLDVYP